MTNTFALGVASAALDIGLRELSDAVGDLAADLLVVTDERMMTAGVVHNCLGRYWTKTFRRTTSMGPCPISTRLTAPGRVHRHRIRGACDPGNAVAELKTIAERANLSMTVLVDS
jgi:hypothetical protein